MLKAMAIYSDDFFGSAFIMYRASVSDRSEDLNEVPGTLSRRHPAGWNCCHCMIVGLDDHCWFATRR